MNTVKYVIHPVNENIDTVLLIAQQLQDQWTTGYIWQQDKFNLVKKGPFLHGETTFGDCIEDEWFIVWILREISKQADVYVNVSDSDGEFLLIESAMHLPKWLDADSASYRSWLYKGDLIVINEGDELNLETAIKELHEEHYFHDDIIQESAFQRIKAYPEQSKTEMHRTMCRLPRRAATVIYNDPAIVSKAVAAFQDAHSPEIMQDDMVDMVVTISRTLYAQLKGQRWKEMPSALENGTKLAYALTLIDHPIYDPITDETLSSLPSITDPDDYLDVDTDELNLTDQPIARMVQQMQSFMSTESGFEGAEFSDDSSESDGFGMDFLRSPIATEPGLSEYMAEMDAELAASSVDRNQDDVDENLATNLTASLEGGLTGPAAGLLGRMGINLPRD